jgi:hypothetical protein
MMFPFDVLPRSGGSFLFTLVGKLQQSTQPAYVFTTFLATITRVLHAAQGSGGVTTGGLIWFWICCSTAASVAVWSTPEVHIQPST